MNSRFVVGFKVQNPSVGKSDSD